MFLSIGLSVLGEVDHSVFEYVEVVHLHLGLALVLLLVFDVAGSLQEVIDNPVLEGVQRQGDNEHHIKQLQLGVALEEGKHVDSKVNQRLSIDKLKGKHHNFGNGDDEEPHDQLDDPHLVVYVLVKFLPGVHVDVLSLVQRKINTTLQDQNVVLVRKVQDKGVDHVADEHSEGHLADEVDEVPLTLVAFAGVFDKENC